MWFWWLLIFYGCLCLLVFSVRKITHLQYALNDQQRRQASRHKFLIIGGGVSGLACGYYFRLMGLNFKIVERGGSVGGTWFWNRYPGVGCDVTSHMYSFSMFLNPNWTTKFPYGAEINDYLVDFWKTFTLDKYTELNTEVTKVLWNEKSKKWHATFSPKNGKTYEEDFNWLISCIGGLHRPNWIQIPDAEKFKGVRVHTADWPEKVDLKGKKVALIGSGASAIQVLPELFKEKNNCAKVIQFQRTPAYCLQRSQTNIWGPFKQILNVYPFGILFRWFRYCMSELRFPMWRFWDTVPLNRLVTRLFKWKLTWVLKDKDLIEKLTPTYTLGCKRILISDEYYESMNDDRYSLVTDKISNLTPQGISAGGKEYEVDVIIYATGFALTENYDFILNHNPTLRQWKDEGKVATYYGTFHEGVPNYVTLLGPMTGLGHNSIIFMIECQVQLIVNVLREMFTAKAETAEIKPIAIQKFMEEWRTRIDRSVWNPKNCTSWYQQGEPDQRAWGIWPGTTTEYYLRTRSLDKNAFIFK